jgi:PAS domain-containing protein
LELGGWQALVHPEDDLILQEQQDKAFKGEPNACEFRIITKWRYSLGAPPFAVYLGCDRKGVAGFYGVGQDITERKNSEKLQQCPASNLRDGECSPIRWTNCMRPSTRSSAA